MVKGINFNQNILPARTVVFKMKQPQSYCTEAPDEIKNFKGAEALASYNSAFVNTTNLNIPLLEPFQVPNDISSVDGEKIYDSDGKLECVIQEKQNEKYVYSKLEDGILLKIINKETGICEFSQQLSKDQDGSNITFLQSYDKMNGKNEIAATYVNEKPVQKSLCKYKNDGSKEDIYFDFNEETYTVCNSNQNKNNTKTYDKNKNLILEEDLEQTNDGYNKKSVSYFSGKPVSVKTENVHGNADVKAQQLLNDPNLQRTPCPKFIDSIENIDGEKTYYSNGQIESVTTNDGKLYKQSFDKRTVTLTDGNKTIYFVNAMDYGEQTCIIEENFGNTTKTTSYFNINKSKDGMVSCTKDNIKQILYFDKDGNPESYEKFDETAVNPDDKLVLGIDFAPNGLVLGMY